MSKAKRLMNKQQRREAQAAQRRRRQLIWIAFGVIAALLLAGGVAWAAYQSSRPAPGEAVPILGQEHIAPGQGHPPYNSDPPTSGWHYDQPADAGFYETSLPDEQLVHNLEHGHVIISYDCSKLTDCEAVKAELRSIVDRFQRWKVVTVPRKNADAPIALTAWGRIDKLEAYDEDRITAFVKYWRDRGPENTAE
jgi:hypothetical protein